MAVAGRVTGAMEDAIHVLDLLLPLADGLGDIRGGLVGRGDVDDEGDTTLLRKGGDGGDVRRVIRAGEELRARVDEPLGLRARRVHLGLAVGHEELEAGAPERPDPACGIDRLHGHLGAETGVLADVGHGAGERLYHTHLDRAWLGVERGRKNTRAHGGGRRPSKKSSPADPNRFHVCVSSLSLAGLGSCLRRRRA